MAEGPKIRIGERIDIETLFSLIGAMPVLRQIRDCGLA